MISTTVSKYFMKRRVAIAAAHTMARVFPTTPCGAWALKKKEHVQDMSRTAFKAKHHGKPGKRCSFIATFA